MDWDKFIFDRAAEILHQGDTVIDVGAHVGKYTEHFLALVGNSGKVISFEINPKSFDSLNQKFKNKPNVTLINAAVSDKTGHEDYYSGSTLFCTNIIGHDVNGKNKGLLGSIESIRLDEYIKEKIDFIKIDVEGAEIKVLKGMERIMDKVKCILIECHFEQDWGVLKDILFNYKLKCIDLKTGAKISSETQSKPYQVFCYNQ